MGFGLIWKENEFMKSLKKASSPQKENMLVKERYAYAYKLKSILMMSSIYQVTLLKISHRPLQNSIKHISACEQK